MKHVIREVRKHRVTRVDPTRSKRAGARTEHPQIGIRNDGRQERLHAVDVFDPEALDATDLNKWAFGIVHH